MHRTIDLSNSMRPLHRNSMLASETIRKCGQKLLPKLRLSLGNKLFIRQLPLRSSELRNLRERQALASVITELRPEVCRC